jgi:hypothetical protein
MQHPDLDILHGDLHPFRRISRSIVDMAVLTGIVVRVLHVLFSARSADLSWYAFAGRFILIPIVALGMASVHWSNYPVRQWLWRAPVFAIIESVTGAVASLALIAAGRERWGTGRAAMPDWPSIAGRIVLAHVVVICLFALLLGAIVQFVRRRELAVERRHQALLHAQHGVAHGLAHGAQQGHPHDPLPQSPSAASSSQSTASAERSDEHSGNRSGDPSSDVSREAD